MKKIKQSETIFIQRSQISFAPYNPRKKDKKVIDSLKANFKKVGFLGGIVWNSLSKNLVGGHKRLETLDLIHGYDGTEATNYEVKVESVEMDDKTEKEQNIYLNNKKQQGETDFEQMAILVKEIDIKNAGLDISDIEIIEAIIPNFEFGKSDEIKAEIKELSTAAKKVGIKKLKNKINSAVSENQTPTHFVVTFKTYEEKAEYLESIGINGDTVFITSKKYITALNEE